MLTVITSPGRRHRAGVRSPASGDAVTAGVALMPPAASGTPATVGAAGGYRVDVDGGRHQRRGVASGISVGGGDGGGT